MPNTTPDGQAPAAKFLSLSDWSAIASVLRLSPREAQISQLVLSGYSEDSIAVCLSISIHTVHSHIERLYRKLQISSHCALVVRLFQTYVELSMGNTAIVAAWDGRANRRTTVRNTDARSGLKPNQAADLAPPAFKVARLSRRKLLALAPPLRR